MGKHEPIDSEESQPADNTARRFVDMCVAEWTKHGRRRDELGPALLAGALNLILETDEPDELAHVLNGLASSIATPTVGNA